MVNGHFPEWAVTGLFYAALHYVDAYLASQGTGVHPTSYRVRSALVARDPVISAVYAEYQELKDGSEDARYRLVPFTVAQVDRLERDALTAIRRLVTPLL